MLQIALLSIGRNKFKTATKLLIALKAFRPMEPSLAVANVILFISKNDFTSAINYAEQIALKQFPEAAMLNAFYGLALLRAGQRNAAQKPLSFAANSKVDRAAAQLAKALLQS